MSAQTLPEGVPTDSAGHVDQDSLTRAQKALLALSDEVAQRLAEDNGVCVRPLAMRRIDMTTGRVDVVATPCKSTREDQCRPCAEKARRERMVQAREGWHLEVEPFDKPADPTEHQKRLGGIHRSLRISAGLPRRSPRRLRHRPQRWPG